MKPIVALLLALAAACGGAVSNMPVVDGSTGVQVLVTIGPTCPVVTEGMDCDDKPYETDLIIEKRSSGKTLGPFRSDADGQFGVSGMDPGEYTIRPAATPGIPSAEPVDFTVRKGRITQVTVRFDSGIR